MAGENLDLSSGAHSGPGRPHNGTLRPFLGMHFACCGAYARVYVNRSRSAYEGNCPVCGKPVRVKIDPGGTEARFFTVY
jgi:hypothetical protein